MHTQKLVTYLTVLLLAASVPAQAQSVNDILGPWVATINAAGQERDMNILVTQEGGTLGLTLSTPQGDQPAEDVSYEGKILHFTIKFGPAEIPIAVTVEGDTFSGKADSPFGPVDIKGKKVSEAELAKQREALQPLVGDWETYSEFQGKRIEGKFRVEIVDGRLMGADASGSQGIRTQGLVPLQLNGDRLMWRIAVPFVTEDGAFVNVTLDRQAMTFKGTVKSSLGDIPLTGKYVDTTKLVQAAYDDPTGVIGDWDLQWTVGEETGPAKMTIVEKDARLHASLSAEAGNYESTSVEYSKIGETMGTLRVHTSIPAISEDELVFEFIIDGDTFEGEEIYTNGEITVTGKKTSGTPSAAAGAPAPSGVTAKAVMGMLDADKDGKITEAEAPEQLKQFFGVVDANADGGIDETEAQTIADFMNSQGGGAAPAAAEPEAAAPAGNVDAKTVMAMGDINKDGKITPEETPEDMRGMFQFVDRNKDGGIDAAEAEVVARALNAQMAAGGGEGGVTPELLQTILDVNEDGKIDMEESPEELKQFFTMVDVNQDGGIDLTETQMVADFVNAQANSGAAAPQQ